MGKASKDRRDIYYRKAKEESYRARSAYKLLQVDNEFDIFHSDLSKPAISRVVDLCAAPGSWSQVIRRKLYSTYSSRIAQGLEAPEPLIVAVDLQEMAPIEGVVQIRGDISSLDTVKKILGHFQGLQADLVVCDGAPDITGMHDIDEFLQHRLLLAALRVSLSLLQTGGTFVAKVFRGHHIGWLYMQLMLFFESVYCVKPASSRVSSLEAFIVCQNFQCPDDFNISLTDNFMIFDRYMTDKLEGKVPDLVSSVPFRTAGDVDEEGDPDRNYPLSADHRVLPPVQPPISAAYLTQKST
eukprot:Gregarina_sp_Poly_1__9636@NODE_60_length_16930_cov_139_480579_g51_i0_p7_GENE_NODE_60_length_16930_cov_139_480579_g51_i0NODE_60_length_16930_cov_139_480579_g51_i0_p7_ORF_typecomplete_len297_score35_70FtsJ/PF01728_19/1_3e60Methyltrans_Mon/PF14314_6/4_8e06Reovirus_L2/PF06016_11/0_017Methyltransf_31/PF13847_6/0_26Methyltr_RsmBF/PF01189_17/0_17NSP16/PF06460_12/0_19_NODE_60_length_16930_cov_139_480579_g51_i043395229